MRIELNTHNTHEIRIGQFADVNIKYKFENQRLST